MVLIKPVINSNVIWVWWISENTLSLNIVELEYFITVLSWQYWCNTHHIFLQWLELLESLKIVSLCHSIIIHIVEETWIVLKTLVPSQEWVVKMLIHDSSIPKHVGTNCSIWNNHVEVLHHALVIAGAAPSCTEAFVSSVFVGAPHVLDSLVHLVLVSCFGHVSGGNKPEGNVLYFQLV